MNIDEKASTPDIAIATWPENTFISRKTMTESHLRRRRAEARARWPMYLADVAYRIEGLPQPRRRHGRTWAQLARDNCLASFPPGIPPWACEALKPEFRVVLQFEKRGRGSLLPLVGSVGSHEDHVTLPGRSG